MSGGAAGTGGAVITGGWFPMHTGSSDRELLRQRVYELRESMDDSEVVARSRLIIDQLVSLPEYRRAATIMPYASFRNEVGTSSLIESALAAGKTVVLPVTIRKPRGLSVRKITSLDQLVAGAYGILEPPDDADSVSPACIDLVIVPGIAFDREGNRLGYGAGYYDTFLSELGKTTICVALAFDAQIVDHIPTHSGDRPVRIVVTESRIIRAQPVRR